jgi:hypothetical protein
MSIVVVKKKRVEYYGKNSLSESETGVKNCSSAILVMRKKNQNLKQLIVLIVIMTLLV